MMSNQHDVIPTSESNAAFITDESTFNYFNLKLSIQLQISDFPTKYFYFNRYSKIQDSPYSAYYDHVNE